MSRSLNDLGKEANTVLNILLAELLRPSQKATGLSDADTLAAGRELIAAGAITIVEHPNGDFSLRVGPR